MDTTPTNTECPFCKFSCIIYKLSLIVPYKYSTTNFDPFYCPNCGKKLKEVKE